MEYRCLSCGVAGEEVILLLCKYRGESLYVCFKCLPVLVQGTQA